MIDDVARTWAGAPVSGWARMQVPEMSNLGLAAPERSEGHHQQDCQQKIFHEDIQVEPSSQVAKGLRAYLSRGEGAYSNGTA